VLVDVHRIASRSAPRAASGDKFQNPWQSCGIEWPLSDIEVGSIESAQR
jgi:hypothetical protein